MYRGTKAQTGAQTNGDDALELLLITHPSSSWFKQPQSSSRETLTCQYFQITIPTSGAAANIQ